MSKELRYEINSKKVKYLCKRDEKIKEIIQIIGNYILDLEENYYEALVKRIIGQQLSLKTAHTIFTRAKDLCGSITPETVSKNLNDGLTKCGVSKQKKAYISDLTEKVLAGKLELNRLSHQNDETVIEVLTQVKGIGIWTSEMFLIFSLGRENILSKRDISIKNAITWLYEIKDDSISWDTYRDLWSPHSTIVSLYLWELVNRNYINTYKNVDELIESIKMK